MAALTFPVLSKVYPSSAEFGLISNTQVFTSPLSGTSQTLEMPGARFHLKANFDNLADADARLLKAFLLELRGAAGRFFYGDPAYLVSGPSGGAAGTPLVNGAAQTGTSLITDGWSNNQTPVLAAGDYAHWTNSAGGRELHMITAAADSDGTGNATFSFEPAIRVAPADGAAITITNAMCQMRLIDDAQARWGHGRGPLFGQFAIEAIETFTEAG